MAEYTAIIEWRDDGAGFLDHRYSRGHTWTFDGGIEVPASSSPSVIPLPMSVAAAVDPEEAFVASLSSCHMLWFLALAAKRGFVVSHYRDQAVGTMRRNDEGRMAVTQVVLRPRVEFAPGHAADDAALDALHHDAHESCYIANSVRSDVRCEPQRVALNAD